MVRNHRHEVTLGPDEAVSVSPEHDHTHAVTATPEQGRLGQYELGAARGLLTARVPILGQLRFLDRSGNPGEGMNVGYEWAYRRYIEGGTLAAAIWRFEGLRREDFGDTLPLEMSIRVFRTYKGDIEEGIRRGRLNWSSPRRGTRTATRPRRMAGCEVSS